LLSTLPPIAALSEVSGWWPKRWCGQWRGCPAACRKRGTADYEPRSWSSPTLYGAKVRVVICTTMMFCV